MSDLCLQGARPNGGTGRVMTCIQIPGHDETFCGCRPGNAFEYTEKLWLAVPSCGRCSQYAAEYRSRSLKDRLSWIESTLRDNRQRRLIADGRARLGLAG